MRPLWGNDKVKGKWMPELRNVSVIFDERFLDHDIWGGDHPEIPGRLNAILNRLQNGPVSRHLKWAIPRKADIGAILEIHTQNYLFWFEEECLMGKEYLGHPDNRICNDSFDVALLAAGAGISGVDLIEKEGDSTPVFCCVRPPGHHAEASMAMGFCFLNNAAITARYWQKAHGRKKVLILDWDAHHGNGIQSAFYDDPEVFYISLHEHPTFSFPGTGFANEVGQGPGEGTTLNIPLAPGSQDIAVIQAMENEVAKAVDSFSPEAVIVASGFDGHVLDDMSGLSYSTKLYARLGEIIARWASEYCEGRVISILEGGYHLEALSASVEAYIAGLAASSG